jgi:hypothetical protein
MMIRRRRNHVVQVILIALVCLLGIGARRYEGGSVPQIVDFKVSAAM